VNPDTRAIRIETFIGDKSGRRGVQERVSQDEGVGRAEGKLKSPQILQIIYDQSLTITFPAMQHPCPAITLVHAEAAGQSRPPEFFIRDLFAL